MSLKLTGDHANLIDQEIWRIYDNRLGGSELSQLAKLFDQAQGLPRRLAEILEPTLAKPTQGYREELDIRLSWIDKRPVAKIEALKNRVELGDAAIFFFDVSIFPKGQHYREARALILQAKVANTQQQLGNPSIPINPSMPRLGSSTANELELLSRWDTLDLYASARSGCAIATKLNVRPQSSPPPNGWYMATPKVRPQSTHGWPSPWMCGPANQGAACDVTLGHLLLALFRSNGKPLGNANLPEAGSSFSYKPEDLDNPGGTGWDRLCIEILRLCARSKLPEHLFGRNRPRGATVYSVMRSFPYFGTGDGPGLPNWLREFLFPRKMAVMIATLRRIEGPADGRR